ncbi:MAG: metallophosphoesterase [Clostridiaceae bacterium]|nr:metallophosphoesterase [Clostridiaceae bacterium]
MKIYEKMKQYIQLLIEKPYISQEIQDSKGPLLLHISDTPEEIHSYIIRCIHALRPTYIIHTGDIVDNIKLEIAPHELGDYKKELYKFIKKLEGVTDATIYYAIGNHDLYEEVRRVAEKGIPLKEGSIMIEGLNFYISHYHVESSQRVGYHLFGHSFEPHHYQLEDEIGLNGLNSMNIIDLSTEKIYHLPYPIATNTFRKMENRRISL